MVAPEEYYHQAASVNPDAVESQMFGKPCYKVNGKAFVAFYEDCMVFKIDGDVHKKALDLKGSMLFDPSGKKRPMKEWVQIPFEHKKDWKKFAQAAFNYVSKNK